MRSNIVLLLLLNICLSCKNHGQSKENSPSADNYEQLFFTIADLDSQIFGADPITSFNLHEDEFLSFYFTLKQPLIESLKKLAPERSEDELLNTGNFQFTFLVDGKVLYVENLNTGAGTKPLKTKELDQVVRLITPERIDFWGWFMWQRFMRLHNGQDELTEGKHSLGIEVRAYLKEDTLKVSDVLTKGAITVEVPKISIDENLVPVQKIQANSGWPLSNDSFDTAKIEALNRKIAEAQFRNIAINGVVVIKNNELLIEEYFNSENRNSLHDVRSVGKSFASTVLGIAIADGHIESEDLLLKDFYDLKSFKNYSPKKDSVTLKSLLTMTSGFTGNDSDYNSPGNEENMYPTANWVKFGLDLPMNEAKKIGRDYNYFTAGVVLLGDVIHKSVPGGLVSYADKKLFAPLNITDYKWQFTPQNVGNTAGGIRLRAIDFAKYGQLYKNKGMWNNKRLLTKDWVEKSLAKQVSQSYAGIEDGYYGYLFWNKVYSVNGRDYEVSFCTGNGGNKIFIFKDIPFVVVITASAYGMPDAHKTVDKLMVNYLLPAILD